MGMLLLAIIILFIIPLLFGTLWNRVLFLFHLSTEEHKSIPGNYLPGVFVMFCLFEGIVIGSMKFDMPFSQVIMITSVIFLLLGGFSCVLCQKELKKCLLPARIEVQKKSETQKKSEAQKESETQKKSEAQKELEVQKEFEASDNKSKRKFTEKSMYILLLVLLIIVHMLLVCHFAPVNEEDNTIELVQTTLTTNTIGMYNPLTGLPYETGLTLQGKLLNLPLFYAYLVQIFSLNPAVFLYRVIPIWVLLMSYFAYSLIADEVFKGEKKENRKQLFLLFYGILILFGGYLFTMSGYQLLYCGWKGETIVITVILPYLLSCGLHFKKHPGIILSYAVASLSVIPLMRWRKGFGYVVLVSILILVTYGCMIVRSKIKCRKS